MELSKTIAGPIGLINQARGNTRIATLQPPEIKVVLATCCTYAGITKQPNDFETKILVDFTLDKLQLFTLEEMILAFKSLAANEFECSQEHYNTLSPSYLGDVMKYYKIWRDRIIGDQKKIMEPLAKTTAIEVSNSDKQDEKEMYEFIDGYCNREQRIPYAGPWTHAYNYMLDKGIINPTEKEKEKIKRIIAMKTTTEDKKDFKYYCKREYTIQYFEMKYGITRPDIIL